jgi:hypothetical protein
MWWEERNFVFSRYLLSPNKGAPELYDQELDRGHGEVEWLGFDEDDGQAMEVFAAEYEGYLFGERFFYTPPQLEDEEEGFVQDFGFDPEARARYVYVPPPPSVGDQSWLIDTRKLAKQFNAELQALLAVGTMDEGSGL